jgi:hypothetical protein
MATSWENNHNVYIVGAGFSTYGGMPVVRNFMDRLRDSVDWLREMGKQRELNAIRDVLRFRQTTIGAGYHVKLNLDDIEELFSLASAIPSEDVPTGDAIPLAIAGTLEYCKATTVQDRLALDANVDDESTHWLTDNFEVIEQKRRPEGGVKGSGKSMRSHPTSFGLVS